jgi:lysozyme family protein
MMIADSAFDAAVAAVLAHEGGYQCAREDAGNWTGGKVGAGDLKGTKYGISAASYPDLDIVQLSEDQARDIYARDWWQRLGLAQLPPEIGAKLLDAAVNIGTAAAFTSLQRALRAGGKSMAEDGRLGPETIAAAGETPAETLLPALREALAGHYRLIAVAHPNLEFQLKGWLARAYS